MKLNENLKNEIKERLNLMGVAPMFRKNILNGDVAIFENQGSIFSDVHYSLELNKNQEQYINLYLKIEELRLRHNLHTYMVQLTHTEFGAHYSLFYVDMNQTEEDWNVEKRDIKENYPYVYVYNADEPLFSEFGSIGIKKGIMGGIVRVA